MAAQELWVGQDHRGNSWRVSLYSPQLPNLIHWVKYGANGRHKLLDQVSDWNGSGWSLGRWIPVKPVVPDYIRQGVERQLQEAA